MAVRLLSLQGALKADQRAPGRPLASADGGWPCVQLHPRMRHAAEDPGRLWPWRHPAGPCGARRLAAHPLIGCSRGGLQRARRGSAPSLPTTARMSNPSRVHKDRKRNFSASEGDAVADFVLHHYDELFGLRSRYGTPAQRETLWRELADAVTALGQEVRTPAQVRRRWQDEKARVKRLAAREADKRALVGPGAAEDALSARDRRIMRVLDAALIVGMGEGDTEPPLSGAGSTAEGTQPSTSGAALARSTVHVAESSSAEEDETHVPSEDLPMPCMIGTGSVGIRQPIRRNLQSLLDPSMGDPLGGEVLVEDTPACPGGAVVGGPAGGPGSAGHVSPLHDGVHQRPATPPSPHSPVPIATADPGARRGPRGRRSEDMLLFEGWNADFARQQELHQTAIVGVGATLTGMAATMVDMHVAMGGFHRDALGALSQLATHHGRLVGLLEAHLSGSGGGRAPVPSPVVRVSPPGPPSPPWPGCPEYLALLRSELLGPRPGSADVGRVGQRPGTVVPPEGHLTVSEQVVAMDVEAQLAALRHGVGRPLVLGDPVAQAPDGSMSMALVGVGASGSRTLAGSGCGLWPAEVASGGRGAHAPVRGVRFGRLAELSSESDTMTVSGASRTPAGVGVWSSGSDTLTESEASLRSKRRACLSSGDATLPLSGDSRRPPSSDED